MIEESDGGERRLVPAPGCYETHDLDLFRDILRAIIAQLRAENSPLVAPDQIDLTKVRGAAAIFQFADGGLRDRERLRDKVLAHLAVAPDRPILVHLDGRRRKPR